MFKPTLYEETHPSSVDFRLQNYEEFLICANFRNIFTKKICIFCADLWFLLVNNVNKHL